MNKTIKLSVAFLKYAGRITSLFVKQNSSPSSREFGRVGVPLESSVDRIYEERGLGGEEHKTPATKSITLVSHDMRPKWIRSNDAFPLILCMFIVLLTLMLQTTLIGQEEKSPPVTTSTPVTALDKTKQDETDTADGWQVFRGNAQSTGVAKTKLPDEFEVEWEFEVPKGGFEGSPLIVEDPKTKKQTVYVGDMDGTLYSLDLATGKKNWETKTPLGFTASPAYQDGKIFIGDIEGFFYCFDDQGNQLWKFETMAEISSSANFFDGHVLFGSQDAKLYLLNVNDGKPVWTVETPDQIRCSATIAGKQAFVAGCDGFLHVIDLEQGKETGTADIKSPTQSTPAALGDQVFFGTEQAEFIAVDWKAVEPKWSFAGDNGQASVRGCAAVIKGHVVFGARDRKVYSLDPITGGMNWAVTLKAKIDSSPIIAGNRIYVGSMDGRFYTLSLENGETIWQRQFNGSFLSSPAAAFGKLVIATDRGVVYCLGKKKPE